MLEHVEELGQQTTHYVVHLPVFEGPLDLLLHLIERRQMEITTISLVAVTDQYLAYLQHYTSDALLANMAAFVAIAARLLFIKSQSLLPHLPQEVVNDPVESAAGMAQEIQRHLVEYKLAKEIASCLRVREESGLQTYGRSGLLAGIEAQLAWTPPTLVGLQVHSLASVFQRLLVEAQTKEADNGVMPPARITVRECIEEIISCLRERDCILLAEVIEHEHSRFVIVALFLAVLELWKWERITVKQDELMGPIMLARGEEWKEEDLT